MWAALTIAAVVLGCALRVLRWIDNPALWLDEAFLSINLIDKSFTELLGSLHFLQSAPPGFLLVEKAAETFVADAEWSLRLFPLLASLAAMVLFGYVARVVLSAPAAALATILFAVSEPLLERAAETKPYSVDVLAATLILALTLRVFRAPPERIRQRVLLLAIVGLATPWLSFPAIFSLAAAIVALGVFALETRNRQFFSWAAIVGALAFASFASVYVVAASNVSRVSSAIFGSRDDGAAFGSLAVFKNAWSTLVSAGGFDNGIHGLAALLAVWGVWAIARRGSLHLFAIFTLPPGLAFAAAVLDKYPLSGRFSLFLVPYLLTLVALGAQWLVSWSRRPIVVAVALAGFLAVSPLAIAAYHAVKPPAREDIRPLLEHVVRNWREGDVLYVYPITQYAVRYYSTCRDCSPSASDFPWPTRVASESLPGDQFAPALESVPPAVVIGSLDGNVIGDLERIPRPSRAWLLFSHVRPHARLDDEALLLSQLERETEATEVVFARGARLYLFELN